MKLSFSRKLIVLYCQNLAGTYKRYSWTNPCLGERHEVSVGFSHVHKVQLRSPGHNKSFIYIFLKPKLTFALFFLNNKFLFLFLLILLIQWREMQIPFRHKLMINYKNTVGDPLQEKFQNFQVFHSPKINSVGIWCPSVTSFALGACLDMPQNTLSRYLKSSFA